MRWLIAALSLLLCSISWWFGTPVGIVTTALAVAGLILARHLAMRSGRTSTIALMPTWQLILPPMLGVPFGLSFGLVAFLLGPGF